MGTSKFNAGDNPAMDYIPSRGEQKYSHLRHAMRTRDKCQPEKQLGLYADFFLQYLNTGPLWIPAFKLNRPPCLNKALLYHKFP